VMAFRFESSGESCEKICHSEPAIRFSIRVLRLFATAIFNTDSCAYANNVHLGTESD